MMNNPGQASLKVDPLINSLYSYLKQATKMSDSVSAKLDKYYQEVISKVSHKRCKGA